MDSFLMTYSEQVVSKRKMYNVQAKTFALNAHGDNQAMASAHHTNGVRHTMAFFHFVSSRTAFFFSALTLSYSTWRTGMITMMLEEICGSVIGVFQLL